MRVNDNNRIPKLIKVLKELSKKHVEIGVFGDNNRWFLYMVARVHEFGTDIKVTPRMRAFFAYQGHPLKSETKRIHIPERSFIRTAHDENIKALESYMEKLLVGVLELKMSADQFYEKVGEWMVEKIQQKITDVGLVKTGALRDSITYRVVEDK